MRSFILASWLWACSATAAVAQYDLQPIRHLSRPGVPYKIIEDGRVLDHAWLGGMNNPIVSEVDESGAGLGGLYVFDRAGGVHLLFRPRATLDGGPYVLDREATKDWPRVEAFALLRDFDRDGVPDLFAYSTEPGKSGIEVYRGIDAGSTLRFERVRFPANPADLLYYDVDAQPTLVYAARTDLPVIDDLDGDGDLDVLSFEVSGSYVVYYENVGTGGPNPADHLVFEQASPCYGGFYESTLDGATTLSDTPGSCARPFAGPRAGGLGARTGVHPGSTLTSYDADGDGDLDLLVGDIGGPNVTLLTNTPDPLRGAFFTAADPGWPADATAVDLPFFPAVYPVRSGLSGQPELLVGPLATASSDDREVLWRYGPDEEAGDEFALLQRDFLVGESLDLGSGTHVALGDLTGDGQDDLLVGVDFARTDGQQSAGFAFYEGQGGRYVRSAPTWLSRLNAAGGGQLLGLVPALVDIDADGDVDVFFGSDQGLVSFAENRGGAGQPADLSNVQLQYAGIQTGVLSAPTFGDLDGDGDADLLVGERSGRIRLYLNRGSATSPSFGSEADEEVYAQINPRLPGFPNAYATPTLTEIGGQPVLYVGTRQGRMLVYDGLPAGPGGSAHLAAELTLDDGDDLQVGFGRDGAGQSLALVGNTRGGMRPYRVEGLVDAAEPPAGEASAWTMQPNPTRGPLRFSGLPVGARVQLIDLMGRLVREVFAEAVSAYDLPPGAYAVRVVDTAGEQFGPVGRLVRVR